MARTPRPENPPPARSPWSARMSPSRPSRADSVASNRQARGLRGPQCAGRDLPRGGCPMRSRVQFRAISGPAGTAQTAAAGASCLVGSGALGGTRTPNLLIRSDLGLHMLPARMGSDLLKSLINDHAVNGGVEHRCQAKMRPAEVRISTEVGQSIKCQDRVDVRMVRARRAGLCPHPCAALAYHQGQHPTA